MKYKQAIAGLLSAAFISLTAATAFAANPEDIRTIADIGQSKEIISASNTVNSKQSNFASITGKVKKIADYEAVKGAKIISIEDAQGFPANIIISKDTYILGSEEIKIGDEITCHYDATAPMIMIYPAQFNAEVAVVGKMDKDIKVDLFNKDLISSDEWLKLNITDETEIVTHEGVIYKGELADKRLIVIYDFITKSIPAQTNPIKVIVLPDKVDVTAHDTAETDVILWDVAAMDIMVNNKKIETPKPYANEQGVVMVPLRAVAEALGYDVKWNNEQQSIMLGKGISLKIGEDNYIYMKTAPIKLGTAPAIVNERTFVPLSFFREVVKMNNAYVHEMQIIIDNEEKMK